MLPVHQDYSVLHDRQEFLGQDWQSSELDINMITISIRIIYRQPVHMLYHCDRAYMSTSDESGLTSKKSTSK